ncbi:MAG: CBS domain-containing protein [Pirellulales bacterium]|nr:CBS domain-containing protein [Pirellulales bacterium]
MIDCPYCGSENLEGADTCDECQLSLTDLSLPRPATLVERGLWKDRIATLAPKKPFAVSPDTPIREVLDQMVNESFGCVMIVENDSLLGIFSEHDALMKLNTDIAHFAERPISSVMTPNPITLELHDRIAFALHKMHVGGYRHLPILEQGKLVGVISIRDILNYLTSRITAEAESGQKSGP